MLLNELPEEFLVPLELLDVVIMELQGLALASSFLFFLGFGSTTWRLGGRGMEALSDDVWQREVVDGPLDLSRNPRAV